MRALYWLVLALAVVMMVLVTFSVLFPFYLSGMHYPSTPRDTFPDKLDEYDSISWFTVTLWGNPFFRDLFWRVGYFGWCLWVPLLAFGLAWVLRRKEGLTYRAPVLVAFGGLIIILFTFAYFVASFALFVRAIN